MKTANLNNLHDGGLKFRDIFRNKRIWLGAATVLVIVLGGLVIYQYYYAPTTAEVATSPEVQTAVARRGDLIETFEVRARFARERYLFALGSEISSN